MKANQFLIDCLEQAADYLESKEGQHNYDFGMICSCNCGILAQVILDTNYTGLEKLQDFPNDYWTTNAKIQFDKCDQTGIPLSKVFSILAKAGLEKDDFYEIEFLNKKVELIPCVDMASGHTIKFNQSTLMNEDYENPFKVAEYFREKAEELRQELRKSLLVVNKKVNIITVKEST